QRLARLEGRHAAGGNLDGFARGRVDAAAGGPIPHLKGAEAHDGDLLPRGQRLADGIQHGLDRVAGGFLRQARLFGDPRNKLRFVHRTFLLWEVFRTRYFGDTFRIPPFGMLSIGDFTSLHTRKCTNSSGSAAARRRGSGTDRKSTRLNSSHVKISYAVFCLKKKKKTQTDNGAKGRIKLRNPEGLQTSTRRDTGYEPSDHAAASSETR